jgi:aspartate racemase
MTNSRDWNANEFKKTIYGVYMKPKPIGIVGGAGPLAAVALLERLIQYAQTEYGCFEDKDFPKILLVSFPFSDMLAEQIDKNRVAQELRESLQFLKESGAVLLAIACNTLHAFLDDGMCDNLISLPQTTFSEVQRLEEKCPLLLCTSTTRQSGLFNKFFPCTYPDLRTQKRVDEIILRILKGNTSDPTDLTSLINTVEAETIVLGCTELSLFAPQCAQGGKKIIDPLDMLAKELIKKSFS